MRITRDSLIQTARQVVAQQVRKNRHLVSVYLTGSLLHDEPLLGRTTDIDLFFIHDSEPPMEREVISMSDEVHVDIAHLSQSIFRQPRELRSDPWIAPFLCANPICLHDTQHWFEFTQASVCAQYGRSDYILQRSRSLADEARQLWMDIKTGMVESHSQQVNHYLKALERSANAIAVLTDIPLTERRLLLQYPSRTAAIGREDLSAGFVDLIIQQAIPQDTWETWLEQWEAAFIAAGSIENPPARLHPCRVIYYKSAAQVMREDSPPAALWSILRTWTAAVAALPEKNVHQEAWNTALEFLGLDIHPSGVSIRALDSYLDNIEETIDLWAQKMGQ